MPEFCSCGTELVPDSLFCHKCGKPTREIVIEEPREEIAVPIPAIVVPKPEPLPLNFHNGVALRIALVVAVSATLLSFLPYLNWLAAGFFAVFFYHRRTGSLLNMESGVRMGWITGVLMFGIMAVLLTASWFFFRAAGGLSAFQAEFKNAMDPKALESLKMLQNGPYVAKLLLQLFVFITLLSMAGGALGAKLVGRQ